MWSNDVGSNPAASNSEAIDGRILVCLSAHELNRVPEATDWSPGERPAPSEAPRAVRSEVVRMERLELSRRKTPEPKSGASTNSATSARGEQVH